MKALKRCKLKLGVPLVVLVDFILYYGGAIHLIFPFDS